MFSLVNTQNVCDLNMFIYIKAKLRFSANLNQILFAVNLSIDTSLGASPGLYSRSWIEKENQATAMGDVNVQTSKPGPWECCVWMGASNNGL